MSLLEAGPGRLDQEAQSASPSPAAIAAQDADENAPLLGESQLGVVKDASSSRVAPYIMLILLLGEFLSHAESTIMFAVGPIIASNLGDLKMAGWLVTAYTIGSCVAQPLYGRLSDIFGRKSSLLSAYVLAAAGCALCGFSSTIWLFIVGRVVTGVGGAGIMTISAIIIADSVPRREVAQYRSYINTASTLGRSLGGPVGGLIMDRMGWPWVFWARLPIFCISALLLITKLEKDAARKGSSEADSFKSRLWEIDYVGAALLSACIVVTMLLLNQSDRGGLGLFFYIKLSILLLSLPAFIFYELHGTKRPIFNLAIFSRTNVSLSYLIGHFQSMAQLSLMYSVPLYFQVTQNTSVAVAGAHLVPAVVANTVGSLLAGYIIRKTGTYKKLLVSVSFIGATAFLLLFLRWNGNTSTLESLYIMPGGFATGMVQSASFVSMTAFLDQGSVAMATGMFFLVGNFGVALGITASDRLTQIFFHKNLQRTLTGPDAAEIIKRVTDDIGEIHQLSGKILKTVVGAFVDSMKVTYFFGLCVSALPSILALFLRDADL